MITSRPTMWPVVMLCLTASAALGSPVTEPLAAAPRVSAAPAPERPNAGPSAAGREEAVRRYLRGRWFEQSGENALALDEYLRALAADPGSTEILLRVSELLSAGSDPGRALEFADRALGIEPGNARAHWLRGAALFNLRRPADALVAVQRSVDLDSTNAEYWKTLARIAETLDRYDLLERAWNRVARADEDDGEAWFQLAAVKARLGDFVSADSAMKRAIELNPARPGAFFLDGWIREGLGDAEGAITLYQHHLGVHAGDATTRRRLIVLLASRRRFREAYDEATRLATSRPEDADALTLNAEMAFAAKKTDEGRKLLARLRALAPDDPELVERSAAVLARSGLGEEGSQLADAWSAKHPGDMRGAMLAARTRAFNGDVKGAVERARAAVNAAPDSLAPRRLLTRILREGKRWKEAEAELQILVQRQPTDLGLRLDLAFCQQEGGEPGASEATVRAALELEPDHAPSLNFLGYMLAEQNRKLEEARVMLERAVASDPNNGAYVDSRGWVYFRLGRYDDARRDLERAVVLSGGDPVIHEHLGDVYRAMARLEQAREQYRLSLADDDNSRVRNKLAELK